MSGQLILVAVDGHTTPAEWILTWLALAGVVLVALTLEGFPPLVWIIAGLMVAGMLAFARHARTTAAILISLGDVVFLAWAAPYLLRAVTQPVSLAGYVAAGLFLVIGITTLIAAGAILREGPEDREAGALASPIAVVAGLLIVALSVTYAGVSELVGEDLAPQPTDFVLEAEELWYSTAEITLRAGTLDLVVDNRDLGVHSFVIDRLGVNTMVPGGIARRVTFSAPPGRYLYYCDIPGHDVMRGRLTLLEDF